MIVVNLFGGPSTGKSTIAATLFSELKRRGVAAELVGEEAKDLIYQGATSQLVNQSRLAAMQYNRLLNLDRLKTEVAVADSPLLQNVAYGTHLPYFEELVAQTRKVNEEFDNINIFVFRDTPYQQHARMQDEAGADIKASEIYELFKEDIHVRFYTSQWKDLIRYVLHILLNKYKLPMDTELDKNNTCL